MSILFEDRIDAGKKLAEALKAILKGDKNTVILAIPRGGVEVAYPVAKELNAPLDVIIPRKVGAPHNPEMAVGAVTPDGSVLWNHLLLERLGLDEEAMAPIVAREVEEIRKRAKKYREGRPGVELKGKTVVLIDDGIATGFTVKAALKSIKKKNPSQIILAVPVGPADTILKFSEKIDTVCLHAPEIFYAVGEFYQNFPPTSHEKVIEYLKELS